mmetsp:Transcript_6330/g.19100  ORF Transcript_6330/g.19100 Transcript_6330/m.19100 type:complete len:223 (+) Transcript_6330:111-779(+)|eukprot:CAMPEP_0198727654 /NCGR_PEP_ID=MMETSP1475-20131203/4691_1 /TAXON_ID= ORGANISM="Unidentified sp., Strain CCMP1999" /NCGR_SAMPLE_ID=MMETSP1475 /ASSEMBLY_ACC=CAM_ASM_001111 /LENGTH=222 /DNA_ID=CAMNT_0044489739 /DNA_START=59 /DNA_END=727 /DNA_ORIENTATION=+
MAETLAVREVDVVATPTVGVCTEDLIPKKNVFVFDWDDTLMATTELIARGALSGFFRGQLRLADELVYELLKQASSMGDIAIVTNAYQSWVELSARRYLPKTYKMLKSQNVNIVSARDKYESLSPSNPAKWKILAFKNDFSKLQVPGTECNMLVVGDSMMDLVAAQEAFGTRKDACLKMVKFLDSPTLNQLITQLQSLRENLEYLTDLKFPVTVGLHPAASK